MTEPNQTKCHAGAALANERHVERMTRTCEYIYQHLDDVLNVEHLSQVAALSPFHFHRVFSSYTGLSVAKFVQLARMRRASFRLAFDDYSVLDIALEAGYESAEAFTRAFKRTFSQTPSAFRQAPNWPSWHTKFQFNLPPFGKIDMQVNIVEAPTQKIAYLSHIGPPEKVLETAGQFIAWRKASGLSPVKTSNTYGIPYSDPKLTDPATFRWDVGGSVDADIPENEYGVKTGDIPGGRFAVVRHLGSHATIEKSVYFLYRDWLPQSGESVRDFPCFFHYINLVHEVDEIDLITDVYLPIQ